MKKLLLIDGNAILHRAYHALPPLTNRSGQVINAAYGFFSMLLNVLKDQGPDYLVVCFDKSKPTIRQSMYAGYHAHRPQMSDDFYPQIVILHELLEKMKVSVFELAGYEGDDMIGTIARKTVEETKDTEVVVLTGDRDMLQLVNHRVRVLMPLTGITKTIIFGEAEVEEKYGVKPSQFVDYKALIGDASDGYPGVMGIGPKTAASLITKFNSFEELYRNLDNVSEKTAHMLATDAEQAALAKKLAAIITDVPVQFSINDCKCSDFDIDSLKKAFEEQGFKSLLLKLGTVFPEKNKEETKKEKKKDNDSGQLELL